MSDFKDAIITQLKKKEIQAIPEVLAFNFMMALIPMLIIFFQILAYLSIETTMLDETIAQYLPTDLYNYLIEFLETTSLSLNNHPVLIIITIGTLILTISKGIHGIFKAFLITYDETVDVPAYKHRIAAILTFFLLLTFGAFATLFITTSHKLLTDLPRTLKLLIELFIFIMLCFSFFFLLFKLAPNKKKSFKELLPGCIFTTIGFILTTVTFSFYVDQLANFHLIYGSLAIIIILLTWLYLIGWMINLGIQVNYVLQTKRTN